jgi:hypothetical protein
MVLCGSSAVVGTDDAGAAVPEHHCANSAEITFEACRSKRARTEGASRAATSSSCPSVGGVPKLAFFQPNFSTALFVHIGHTCCAPLNLTANSALHVCASPRCRNRASFAHCHMRVGSALAWLCECVVGARGGLGREAQTVFLCVLGDAGDFAVLCVCVCVTPSSLCLFWTHAVARGYTPLVCADARLLHFAFAVCAVAVRFLVSIRRGVCVL